jgi:hypothetical protein
MITIESTASKAKNQEKSTDAYDLGLQFIDDLVKMYPDDVRTIANETLGANYSMVSLEQLKKIVKQAIKDQNQAFITKLSLFLSSVERSQYKEVESFFPAIGNGEMYLGAGGVTLTEALSDLGFSKAQYDSDASIKKKVDDYMGTISGGTADDKSKEGIDWTKALDTTGKVAQSIFFLGNIFSKREDQPIMPNLAETETDLELERKRLIRNVVIVSIVVIGLGIAAYFMLRKKA